MPALAISVMIAAALTLTGCGARSKPTHENTRTATTLVIHARNNVAGAAVLTLHCDPPGGTLPDATAVCARLSHAAPGVLLHPRAFRCPGTQFAPWDLHIRGHAGHELVHVDLATCLTPQVPLIRVLGITPNQLRHLINANR